MEKLYYWFYNFIFYRLPLYAITYHYMTTYFYVLAEKDLGLADIIIDQRTTTAQ